MKVNKKIFKASLKDLWSFLDQFSGVLAAIIIIWGGAKYVLETLSFSSPVQTVLFAATIIFFAFVGVKKTIDLTHTLRRIKDERTIRKYMQKVETRTEDPNEISFEESLPENKVLEIIVDKQDELAKDWASDAILVSSSFDYIKWDEKEMDVTSFYWSNFKKTQLRINMGLDGKISTTVHDYRDRKQLQHFFIIYPRWKEALLKIHNYLEDRLSAEWDMSIYAHSNKLSIIFSFTEGRVEKDLSFTLTNNRILEDATHTVIATL